VTWEVQHKWEKQFDDEIPLLLMSLYLFRYFGHGLHGLVF
jgi:hypothetical protein